MALDYNELLARKDVKAFFLTHDALGVITAMFDHAVTVAAHYGADSAEYIAELQSLTSCLTQVFGRPAFGRRMFIVKDGDQSLFCNEDDAFVFGMVFHRDRSTDDADATPGSWSLHS